MSMTFDLAWRQMQEEGPEDEPYKPPRCSCGAFLPFKPTGTYTPSYPVFGYDGVYESGDPKEVMLGWQDGTPEPVWVCKRCGQENRLY